MTDEHVAPPENGRVLTVEIRRGMVLPRVTAVPAAGQLSPVGLEILAGGAEDTPVTAAVVPAERPLPAARHAAVATTETDRGSRMRLAVLGGIAAAVLVAVPLVALFAGGGGHDRHPVTSVAGGPGVDPAKPGAPAPSWPSGDPSGRPVNSGTPAPGKSPAHSSAGGTHGKKAGGSHGGSVANPPHNGTANNANPPVKSDSSRLLMSAASNRCIDVKGGTGKDGTPLDIWDCVGGSRQRWTFESDGSVHAMGMCMDVAWGSSDNGTQIQLARCHGGPAQHFDLNGAGDLVNTGADKCVDVTDQRTGNGTRLQLWDCGGTSNQKWSAV